MGIPIYMLFILYDYITSFITLYMVAETGTSTISWGSSLSVELLKVALYVYIHNQKFDSVRIWIFRCRGR